MEFQRTKQPEACKPVSRIFFGGMAKFRFTFAGSGWICEVFDVRGI